MPLTPKGPSHKTTKVHPTRQSRGSLSCICFFNVKDKRHSLVLELVTNALRYKCKGACKISFSNFVLKIC